MHAHSPPHHTGYTNPAFSQAFRPLPSPLVEELVADSPSPSWWTWERVTAIAVWAFLAGCCAMASYPK